MTIKEIKDNYYFENLSDKHDLSDFDCGDKDLNDFLKNDALAQQNARLNVTKLIMCDGNIIGFTSLLTDGIMIKKIRNEKVKLEIKEKLNINSNKKSISAVKIGRLAIDKKYARKGLGSHILNNILKNLKDISEKEVEFRFILIMQEYHDLFLGRCDEQLPFNLLYNLGLYVSAVIMTDNPVVRVILARNCIIGDNNVGCMRV